MTLENKILSHIISAQIGTYTSLYAPSEAVITSTQLAQWCGVSKYKARKALKALVEQGLIEYKSQGCPAIESCGEYRELVCDAAPPINGYCLTKKGYQSDEYKAADREFAEDMRKMAEGRI